MRDKKRAAGVESLYTHTHRGGVEGITGGLAQQPEELFTPRIDFSLAPFFLFCFKQVKSSRAVNWPMRATTVYIYLHRK